MSATQYVMEQIPSATFSTASGPINTPSITSDIKTSSLLSEEAKFVFDIMKGDPPSVKEDASEMYHQMTLMFGTWVVSKLSAIEQKAVLGALWVEKKSEEAISTPSGDNL